MQTTRPASIAALLLAASLLLSGCGSGGTEPTASPQSSGEPVFASEEEALAAAEEVYRAYMSMTDQVLQQGGLEPERLEPFVTADVLEDDLAFIAEFADNGRLQTGSVVITKVGLQQYSDKQGLAQIMLYVCADMADVAFSPAFESPNKSTAVLEVGLEATQDSPIFRVSGVEPWSSALAC